MTIIDVARVAGVSVSTVSKVINDRYGVAPETYDKVMDVVAELGYESSLVASSLRRHSTNVIGVLVPEFEPFSAELLKGISSAAEGTGYELLAYSGDQSHNNVGWERRSLSRLAGTLIDGAVIVAPTATVTDTTIPVVAVDPHTGRTGPSTIESDNVAGARTATEHLIGLGHSRIAHVRGRTDLVSARQREQGYRRRSRRGPRFRSRPGPGRRLPGRRDHGRSQGAAQPSGSTDRRLCRQRPFRHPGPRDRRGTGPSGARGPVGGGL